MPTVRRATTELCRRDPVLAGLVAAHGPCSLKPLDPGDDPETTYFAALARAVVFQQLAGKAAAAIHARFEAALDGQVTVDRVLAADPDALRGAGLSKAKAATITALAEATAAGDVELAAMPKLGDEEVAAQLTAVRGIGPWTAHMFLLFDLGRLDVWPIGDYGVRKGYALAWNAPLPTPSQLLQVGEQWRPYRSVVAWYCWRAVDVTTTASA